METTINTSEKILKTIVLSQLLVEAIDDIKRHELYNGKIKIHARTLVNLLAPFIKRTKYINDAAPYAAIGIYNHIDGLGEKLGDLDVQELVRVNQFIEDYKKSPKKWDIYFTK